MRHKEVLFISPPNAFLANPRSVPRIGLLYLGTILKKAGHAVTIQHLSSLQELAQIISRSQFDFIGVSATTREYPDALQILNYLKRENHPATVAIGGAHATALPEECERNGFDLVVVGEAEAEIEQIVELESRGQRIIDCGYLDELDQIPIPDRALLNDSESWYPYLFSGQHSETKITSILLSRGCPYQCKFCGVHARYRRRSNENIRSELYQLKQEGYSGFVLLDDLPFIDEKQVQAFAAAARPLGIQFRCNFRPNLLTNSSALNLAEAGCRRIQLGIESATQTILDAVKKGITVDVNAQALSICRYHGIEVKAMFVWGLPGDGPEAARAIIEWVERYRPDSIQISCFAPLPRSPLWEDGYHRRVIDYRDLSFFSNGHKVSTSAGIGNDRFSGHELWVLYEKILTECAAFTHIDLGLGTG